MLGRSVFPQSRRLSRTKASTPSLPNEEADEAPPRPTRPGPKPGSPRCDSRRDQPLLGRCRERLPPLPSDFRNRFPEGSSDQSGWHPINRCDAAGPPTIKYSGASATRATPVRSRGRGWSYRPVALQGYEGLDRSLRPGYWSRVPLLPCPDAHPFLSKALDKATDGAEITLSRTLIGAPKV